MAMKYIIRRYTTPYHSFVLPFRVEDIADLTITYFQNGVEIVRKDKADVSLINVDELIKSAKVTYVDEVLAETDNIDIASVAKLRLSQDETSSFTFHKAAEKNIVLIQIRLRDKLGNAFVSRPIKIRLYGSISEGVL